MRKTRFAISFIPQTEIGSYLPEHLADASNVITNITRDGGRNTPITNVRHAPKGRGGKPYLAASREAAENLIQELRVFLNLPENRFEIAEMKSEPTDHLDNERTRIVFNKGNFNQRHYISSIKREKGTKRILSFKANPTDLAQPSSWKGKKRTQQIIDAICEDTGENPSLFSMEPTHA